MSENLVVGLDIGSHKVCTVIAERNEAGNLEVLGVGRAPSEGLKAGLVVNIESTLRSVGLSIEAAEQMAGREVESVHIGIAGAHIEGINSRGVVAVSSRGREITASDIERVMEAARAIVVPMDREIFHVIPQEYIVDSTPGVKNPIDMIGVRLEAEVHVVTASVTAAQNIVKCVNRAGFEVNGISLSALAGGNAVVSQDEKEMGCVFIDIGGGTSDIIVYRDGAPIYTSVLPIGGQAISSDISIILKTTIENAEKLKVEYGSCWKAMLDDPNEGAFLPGFLGRTPIKVSRGELCDFIEPRVREIFGLIRQKIEKESRLRGLSSLGAGIIIGGGGALLSGITELSSDVFGLGSHIGSPLGHGGVMQEYRQPDVATAYGLALEASMGLDPIGQTISHHHEKSGDGMSRLKKFFKSFF